ncbi:TetR/AcrR family transcriptional regulator [Lentzea nigeriaca]|uniref:TetR/AcrR family transcriptional regulator n=1 Tax=Lentzea nigeriaca TaxID=1128665 RepID=UPI00195AF8CA|nr:TetR/AcrR family transcriptional regulator [Lentzea nigeriaca]MBM7860102.1 AcrR family transcriptional regulator [Lentzea nigeriaca]
MSVQLLDTATSVLLKDPTASLGDVAKAAGVGRTTLHKRFPTRADLIHALATEALDLVGEAISSVDLDTDDAIEQLVEKLVPLGPRIEFLLRFPNLRDDERLSVRLTTLDQPVIDLISRLQGTRLRADLPAWWITQILYAGVYSAWEGIAAGRLAPLDAPRLVLTTFYLGVSDAGAADRS